VLYFANPSTHAVREAMIDGHIAFIDTPAQGNRRPAGITWCADNGCFGKGYPGDERWFAWLSANADDAATCRFAVAPDVVGDAAATLERSQPWLGQIRSLGYPVALAAQDGLENLTVPWDEFDALFIGGSTDWKLGPHARTLVAEAKRRGKWVYMGRVNSERRYQYARLIGCDSADGTTLALFPDATLPDVLAWIRGSNQTTFAEASA
jgi:hypothetical protein